MKICPTCQATYPNGFQYCPNDTDVLLTREEYALRSQPAAPAPATEVIPLHNWRQAKSSEETAKTLPFPQVDKAEERGARPAGKVGNGQVAEVKPPAARVETEPLRPTEPLAPEAPGPQPWPGRPEPSEAPVSAAATADLSFTVPETGNLFTRIREGFQQFVQYFGKSAPTEAGEFHFLLEEDPLYARFGREIQVATSEFRQDPKAFVVSLARGEGNNKQRRRVLVSGSALAVIVYSFIIFVIPAIMLLVGGTKVQSEEAPKEELAFLAPLTEMPKVDAKKPDVPKEMKGKGGFTGGSKPKIEQARGGGGGGRQTPTPPSKGVPPQMALTPQILPPRAEPPTIKNPSLPVPMTAYGDPKALPQLKGPIGDPTAAPAPPSSGPGAGAGVGRGSGTGVGGGEGGGVGPGRGGNAGGGDFGLGGGRGPGGSGGIEDAGKNGAGKPNILYKEKAKYTEEARQNKIQGTVMLTAVFTADGRITGIRVIRGLPDGLTEKAIEAAQKIRFQPATKNGAAVSVRANLEFTFNLY